MSSPYQLAILSGVLAAALVIYLLSPARPSAPAAAPAASEQPASPDAAPTPEDPRSRKVAVRCAIDTVVLTGIGLAIVAVAWHEQQWGTLLDALHSAAGVFPAEAAFLQRLLR